MLRTGACFTGSGRKRSTTSITLPNMAMRNASRSASLAAQAHISSSDFGRLAHVEATDGPRRRLGPGRHLGHAEHRLDPERLAQVLEQLLGVRVQEDGRWSPSPSPMLADWTSGS